MLRSGKIRKRYTSQGCMSPKPFSSNSVNDYDVHATIDTTASISSPTTHLPIVKSMSKQLHTPQSVTDSHESTKCSIADQATKLSGIDMTYTLDSRRMFQLDSGEQLTGDKLIEHLMNANEALVNKVNYYSKKAFKMEDKMFTIQDECRVKNENIRGFYRDLIYYSNSRSAEIFKSAIRK